MFDCLDNMIMSFQASDKLGELIQMVDRCEPRNPFLYHDLSQAFSRLVCNISYFMSVLS